MDEEDDYTENAGYGLFSPGWMLEQSLMGVSHPMLFNGVMALVDYLTAEEQPEVAVALDVLAQTALVGCYHDPHSGEISARLTEEEQDDLIQRFNRVLGGVPTTEDDEKENNE